mgnify:CR=1 FL=1
MRHGRPYARFRPHGYQYIRLLRLRHEAGGHLLRRAGGRGRLRDFHLGALRVRAPSRSGGQPFRQQGDGRPHLGCGGQRTVLYGHGESRRSDLQRENGRSDSRPAVLLRRSADRRRRIRVRLQSLRRGQRAVREDQACHPRQHQHVRGYHSLGCGGRRGQIYRHHRRRAV